MKPEAQQIAIAEACGFKWEGGALCRLPDYLNDLNAMRNAIEAQPIEVRKAIRGEVWRLSSQMTVLPPASVFAEAFLRATGRWVQS